MVRGGAYVSRCVQHVLSGLFLSFAPYPIATSSTNSTTKAGPGPKARESNAEGQPHSPAQHETDTKSTTKGRRTEGATSQGTANKPKKAPARNNAHKSPDCHSHEGTSANSECPVLDPFLQVTPGPFIAVKSAAPSFTNRMKLPRFTFRPTRGQILRA